jgi:hypothetical protein
MDHPVPPVPACHDPGSPDRTGPGPDDLRRRLARARARLEAAAPYSPDWDAAMAEIEEIEGRLSAVGPAADGLGLTSGASPPNTGATAAA